MAKVTQHDVGPADAFAEDTITAVTVDDRELVIVRQDGRVYAMPDRCTHAKKPLHDGELDVYAIEPESPTPMAFGIASLAASDVVLAEDEDEVLREFHARVMDAIGD